MNGAEAKLQPMDPKRQKVLVIDDDLVICKFMERIISDAGHEVRTVSDGLSALDVLHFYRPHVIFLDIVLPDMDGRALCRMIRGKNELKSIYIAILSGIVLEEDVDLSQLDADALVAKGPISQMDESVRQILIDPEGVRKRCRSGEIIGTENIYPRKMTAELLSSNRHFSLVLENMGQGILELSPDGRILFVNGAAASFFKKTDVELLASPFISLIDEKDRPRVDALIKHQNTGIFSIPDNAPMALNDRLFSMETLPYTSDRGHITLIMTDVTRINHEADSLRAGEKRLSRIINHFSDALILTDANGVVQLVNPAAEKLFGRNVDDFIGSSFGFPVLAGETSELDIINTGGTLKVGEMRSVEIHWDGEKTLLAAIRDVTSRKQMEEDLRSANEKILEQQEKIIEEERLKVLLQMSGATAHELNQPLAVLLGNVDLMRTAEGDPKEIALCMDQIEKAGRRIADTIKKIQNIRHYETKPYGSGGRIVNIEQNLHILSIEDSDEDYDRIQSVLNSIGGIQVTRASTLEDGLRLIEEISPDLVLLDYLFPGGDGFDFIRALKAEHKDVPLVILTGQGDEMVASRLIQEGADDYLTKSRFDRESIATCFRNVLEKGKLKREIRTARRKISEMATLDELTGLYNRRYFMEALERERSRAQRHGKALSLCMMDLDFFKSVNDKLGHGAGDLVLADMGRIIREWSRQSDVPCRYGGEEFAVILPETDIEGARVACERLRQMVEENQVPWRTGPIRITASMGVAQNRTNTKDSIRKLIDRADEALYRAKETGRNRVKVRNGG